MWPFSLEKIRVLRLNSGKRILWQNCSRVSDTNLCEGKIFFDSLRHFFFPHSLKIIGGDFNCFESEFDKFQGNICISSDLRDFRTLHRWIDI